MLLASRLLACGAAWISFAHSFHLSSSHLTQSKSFQNAFIFRRTKTELSLSRYEDFFADRGERCREREEMFRQQLAELFGTEEQLVPLSLAGRCTGLKNGVPIDILLLSEPFDSQLIQDAYNKLLQSKHSRNERISALPVPLLPNSSIRLLSHACAKQPLSKTKMLVLNSLLVNRDGGLFDNLPWASWTIDPDGKERDAANNAVNEKYSMGKRVAYQRFMGKDWRGRLSSRLKNLLADKQDEDDALTSITEEQMMASLSKRILEVEVADARAEVAEYEQQLYSDFADAQSNMIDMQMLDEARLRLKTTEASLKELTGKSSGSGSIRSALMSILTNLNEEAKEAPYRGAIGYPPKKDDPETNIRAYTSPYSMLMEIINEQLNAEVVACVLEQTSLFEGNLVLGGAIVLRRKEEVGLANGDVNPKSLFIVECFSDEAIAMSVESDLPICIESGVWKRVVGVDVEIDLDEVPKLRNHTTNIRLPIFRPVGTIDIAIEGERVLSEQNENSIRLPMTTTSSIFDKASQMIQPVPDTSNAPVFSTFSPVDSLDDYDSLTNDDKARILLKMESFQGVLPRPRVVQKSTPSALDNLLLPLIDESVRRQFLMRNAEQRNDFETLNALREEMSPRQSLLEGAQDAREMGREDEALRLENEAEMLKATRADFTQDEGSYSKFLDRDDWYERESQARIARYKKSRGIE